MSEDEPGADPQTPGVGPGHEPDWASLVVPDDIRELAADIAAYRSERRRGQRRERLQALAMGPARRHGMSGRLTVIVLVVVAIIGGLMVLLHPTAANDPQRLARPLAHPAAAAGALGGLLPDATVDVGGIPMPLHDADMRPAVYLLLRPGCDCESLIDRIVGQAVNEARVRAFVAVPAAHDASLRSAQSAGATGVFDRADVLALAYRAETPTVLLVASDGRVTRIVHSVGPQTHLTALSEALR